MRFIHHAFPLEIARNSYHNIESVEESFEWNSLDNVEIAADGINDNPEEPLLDVFLCQCPKSDEAQRVREGIKDRDCAVGEVGKDIVCRSPCEGEECEGREVGTKWHAGNAGG